MLNLNSLKNSKAPFDERYQLIDRIGSGGFSEVWLALDLRSQVDVVIKIYASSQELDEEGTAMFRKEFSLICNLSHTNILKPFTFDLFQGIPYIVLPYCEKGSASKLIGEISEDGLWDFARQVASGLAHLHKHGIIHQDIKPANILINADDQYMITDFGISTGLRNTIRRSQRNDPDSGSGTTAYMSYECLGPKPSNLISRDIWAFGATLYELATGDVPFGELGGITQYSLNGKVPKIEKDLSKGMKELIYKCLSLNTWDRPSADEIVGMVDMRHDGVRPPRKSPWKKIAAATAAVTAAVTAGMVFQIFTGNGEEGVSINHNDSIFLSKVKIASELVRIESEKENPDSIDETKLCTAAQIYNDAIKLDSITDTAADKGKSMWTASQKVIDQTYTYLYNKGVEYGEIGAESAAETFGERSRALAGYVSDSAKSNAKKTTKE